MLQKNGYTISSLQKDFKEDFEIIGSKKKQVVFKLVNSIYNGKDKKPRGFLFPSAFVVNEKNGDTTQYQYFTSEKKENIGGMMTSVFVPDYITFNQRGELVVNLGEGQTDNNDLFILMMRHPRRAKGANGSGHKDPLFYLEDTNAEAIEYAVFKKAGAAMDKLLWDEDSRLEESVLRTIAKALRVSNVDELGLAAVQKEIEAKCSKNPSLFLSMKGVNKDTEMRSNLQTASERGVIFYDNRQLKWYMNNQDSGNREQLCQVRTTENEMDSLVYWLKNVDPNDCYGKIVELTTGEMVPFNSLSQLKKEEETPDFKAFEERMKKVEEQSLIREQRAEKKAMEQAAKIKELEAKDKARELELKVLKTAK